MSDTDEAAARARAARAYGGYGHREFADLLGISESSLRRVERGDRKLSDIELKRVVQLTKVPAGWLGEEAPAVSDDAAARIERKLDVISADLGALRDRLNR